MKSGEVGLPLSAHWTVNAPAQLTKKVPARIAELPRMICACRRSYGKGEAGQEACYLDGLDSAGRQGHTLVEIEPSDGIVTEFEQSQLNHAPLVRFARRQPARDGWRTRRLEGQKCFSVS